MFLFLLQVELEEMIFGSLSLFTAFVPALKENIIPPALPMGQITSWYFWESVPRKKKSLEAKGMERWSQRYKESIEVLHGSHVAW